MAELIDRKPIIKRVKRFAEYEWNGSRKQAYMEFLDMLTDAPTITEAEIRAKAFSDLIEKIRGSLELPPLALDYIRIFAEQLKEEY